MVNLLRLVREFVEDETRRAEFRADPSVLITATGGDLSGEDVEAALDVVRTQVEPAIAGRLAPDDHDLRFPRLTPGDNETPLTVGLRCMRWIDRRLGATVDDADTEFEAALFDLTGYEPPTLPSPSPDDVPAPESEDDIDDDGDTTRAIPLLDINRDAEPDATDETTDDDQSTDSDQTDTDESDIDADATEPAGDDETDDDTDESDAEAETDDEPRAWAIVRGDPDEVAPTGEPAADHDPAPAEAQGPDPVEAGIPVATTTPDTPRTEDPATSDRGGRSLFGGGAAMKLPFTGDTDPIDLPFAGDQFDLPFASDESDDDDTTADEPDAAHDSSDEGPAEGDDAAAPPVDVDGPGARLEPGLEPQFRTLEVVVLPLGLPEVGVPAGTQATVVAVHLEPSLHYEIEVDDEDGAPAFLGAVTPDSLAPLPR